MSDEVLKKGKVIEAVSVVEAIKKALKKSGGKMVSSNHE